MDRVLRIALSGGLLAFAGFWVISVWLETAASGQPGVATGAFQHPYALIGHVTYLTSGQAGFALLAHVLAYGSWIAALAAIGIMYGALRGDRARAEVA